MHKYFLSIILGFTLLLTGCNSGLPGGMSASYAFDGSGKSIYVPDEGIPQTNFTYEFWAEPLEEDELDPITFKSENHGYYNQHFIVFPEKADDENRGTGVSLGKNVVSIYEHKLNFFNARITHKKDLSGWHHFAVVYSDNTPTLFIDGKKVGTAQKIGPKVVAKFNLGEAFGRNYPFKGNIGEFRVWNRTLSEADVQKYMNTPPAQNENGLVLRYTFAESDQFPAIIDHSGNGLTGTIQSPPETEVVSEMKYAEPFVTELEGIKSFMNYSVDHFKETEIDIYLSGWAFITGLGMSKDKVYIVFRGPNNDYIFDTELVPRQDVTETFGYDLTNSGFKTLISKKGMAAGEYHVFILIIKENGFKNIHEIKQKVVVN